MASPLISPTQLASLDGAVLLDARSKTAFEASHLRGALNVDPSMHLSAASEPNFDPSKGGRHPLPSLKQWRATLGRLGIGPDTAVVVYDDQSGAISAARTWWMLKAIGHDPVWVLDGGLKAAISTGCEVTTDPSLATPCAHYPATAWLLPTVDLDVVEKLAKHPKWRVLDVRSPSAWPSASAPGWEPGCSMPGEVRYCGP